MPAGALALLTEVAGATLARFGGGRLTRLAAAAVPGDDHLTLERGAGLPPAGRLAVGGIVYTYAALDGPVALGVAAQVGGLSTPGVVADHPLGAQVVDASRTFSELDALYRDMFIATASGDALAALGRNLGVDRFESLRSDDAYRAVIQAIAYAPRGTRRALTAALDAILGAGNYSIDIDPYAAPATVTIRASQANFTSRSPIGATYLTPATLRTPDSNSGAFAIRAPYDGHGRLTLADREVAADVRAQLPSAAAPAGTWARQGDQEASACRIATVGPGATATQADLTGAYVAAMPATAAAQTTLAVTFAVSPAAGLATAAGKVGCGAALAKGGQRAAWGVVPSGSGLSVALYDAQGAPHGATPLPSATCTLTLALGPRGASLRLDGRPIAQLPLAQLPSSTLGQAAVGNLDGVQHGQSGGAPPALCLRALDLAVTDRTELGADRGPCACLAPDQVAISAAQVGQQVWLAAGASPLPPGVAGRYVVVAAAGGDAQLAGEPQAGGSTQLAGGQTTFTAAEPAFAYPADLGKRIVITGGGAGVDGTYVVQALLDPANGRDLSTYATALPARASQAVLAGGAPLSAGSLTWRLLPAFPGASVTAAYTLSPTLQVAAQPDGSALLTPSGPLAQPTAAYVLPCDDVLGGMLQVPHVVTNRLLDPGPPPAFATYPFYLTDPFDALEAYLPNLLAAGVEAVVRYD